MLDQEYQVVRLAMAQLGVPLPPEPQTLGSGAYASVFATEDNRVVKVTEDLSERYAAELVRQQVSKGTPHPNVVRVDHVFTWGSRTVTVNERLTPLTEAEMRLTEAEMRLMHDAAIYDVVRDIDDAWVDNPGNATKLTALQRAQVLGIRAGLLAAGITSWTDFHQWNVMKRANPAGGWHYVVSDLGRTKSPAPLIQGLPLPGVECGDDGDQDDGEAKREAADLKAKEAERKKAREGPRGGVQANARRCRLAHGPRATPRRLEGFDGRQAARGPGGVVLPGRGEPGPIGGEARGGGTG